MLIVDIATVVPSVATAICGFSSELSCVNYFLIHDYEHRRHERPWHRDQVIPVARCSHTRHYVDNKGLKILLVNTPTLASESATFITILASGTTGSPPSMRRSDMTTQATLFRVSSVRSGGRGVAANWKQTRSTRDRARHEIRRRNTTYKLC